MQCAEPFLFIFDVFTVTAPCIVSLFSKFQRNSSRYLGFHWDGSNVVMVNRNLFQSYTWPLPRAIAHRASSIIVMFQDNGDQRSSTIMSCLTSSETALSLSSCLMPIHTLLYSGCRVLCLCICLMVGMVEV